MINLSKTTITKLIQCLTITLAITFVSACSDNTDKNELMHKAVAMESSDECHICGMLITRFGGPKGEIFRKEQDSQVLKFCSTKGMFSYYLDPENTRNVRQLMVHDMSKMPWGSEGIDDKHLIDAKKAWFVAGSSKNGAMGKTLASFSLQTDAQAFSKEFGGKVLSFHEVTQENL